MNNTIESIKGRVSEDFFRAFPHLQFSWSHIEGEESHLGFNVFGVEESLRNDVFDFVCDLEETHAIPVGLVITPVVRSLEVTRKHYPNMLPIIVPPTVRAFQTFRVNSCRWTGIAASPLVVARSYSVPGRGDAYVCGSTDELQLAA